jgi:hypothetical protein
MNLNLKFQAAAKPATGFTKLKINAKDSGGVDRFVEFTAAEIQAAAQSQGDGTYLLPASIGGVGVGPCHLTATCYYTDASGFLKPFGNVASADIDVPLSEGDWYPAPVAFV